MINGNLWKNNFCDRVVCFEVFGGLTPLVCFKYASSFLVIAPFSRLQYLSKCFPIVCISALIAAVLKKFPTTYNLCNFWRNKFRQFSTNTFCSWDDIFTEIWNCGSTKTCVITPDPLPCCRPRPLMNGFSTSLEAIIVNHPFCQKWTLEAFLNIKTRQVKPTDTKSELWPLVFLESMSILWRNF